VEIAGRMAADRLRLSAFARIYAGSAVALVLALAYLAVGAQATQNAYSLSQLKDRNAQLVAEQDQLRYQSASLHGPGQIQQEAQDTGLQRPTAVTYIDASPAEVDLSRPIGPAHVDSRPPWERLFEALFGGHEALSAGPP
jgi:cell division protein FtsB